MGEPRRPIRARHCAAFVTPAIYLFVPIYFFCATCRLAAFRLEGFGCLFALRKAEPFLVLYAGMRVPRSALALLMSQNCTTVGKLMAWFCLLENVTCTLDL